MKVYYEWGIRQINKRGEELCGDSVAVSRHPNSVTLALSDGLGSGVLANILATLTTQIATHLLENQLPLGEVVEKLSKTLPVCRTREVSYSTFAIAEFFNAGTAKVVMFDSPMAVFLRGRKILPIVDEEHRIEEKTINECVAWLGAPGCPCVVGALWFCDRTCVRAGLDPTGARPRHSLAASSRSHARRPCRLFDGPSLSSGMVVLLPSGFGGQDAPAYSTVLVCRPGHAVAGPQASVAG